MSRKQRPRKAKQAARRRIPLVLLALALGFAATASAGVGQWTSTGPDGGPVTALAISPANAAVMYAGTSAGLFVSQNAGESWTFSSALPPGVGSIVIDNAGQTLYAAAGGRVYRTSDGGVTWSKTTLTSFPGVVAIDPDDPSRVYAGTTEGLVYRSTDGGSTWSPGGVASPEATSIAVVPGTSTTAYLAGSAGVFKTTDGGESWTRLTSLDTTLGPITINSYFVAIDPAQPQIIFASRSSETGCHLCSSNSGGSSWGCGGNLFSPVAALGFDHSGQTRIYAATSGGLYKSVDSGMNWTKSYGGLSVYALAVTPEGTAALFAGTSAGVFRSTDHAGHWSSSGAGIHATTIPSLATAPIGMAKLFAGTDASSLFARNGDQGWKALEAAPETFGSIAALAVSPSNPDAAFAGGYAGIIRTDDGFDHGAISTLRFPVSTIAIDPTAPTNVYAGQAERFELRGGVSKSSDGGATWNPTTLTQAVYALVIDSLHPSTIYAGTDFDAGYYGGGGGIFKSTDAGETWTKGDRRFGNRVLALAIDPRNSSTVYAGVRFFGIFKSTDGATTWNHAGNDNFPNVSALVVDPVLPGRVYAATDESGVIQSQNGGQSWFPLGTGLPALPIRSLAIEPDGSALHAGTAGAGVFDYALSARGPCAAGSLCLLGNRFEVNLYATDPGRGLTSSGAAIAQGDRFGYFSLPEFTGDPALPEVLVKMVDASATSFESFWFFYSGLTSLPYTVSVRDTVTGLIRTYESDGYCGGADTSGFKADSSTGSASIESESSRVLSASGTELSLLSNRFRVTLSATDPHRNQTSDGVAIAQDDRFGYFSLPAFTGDESFPEVFVKMVDGRSLPGKAFWVFYTGLTSLHYTITVTDTVTGEAQTYDNSSGGSSVFCGGADTTTFRDPQ